MSESDKLLEILVDFANALESACVNLKRYVAELKNIEDKPKWNWNPDKIAWSKAQGSKGEYERSEDANSLDFKNLLKDLSDHKGSLIREGWFYWSFPKNAVIGRKKKVKA